jgi:putative membrane protein
MSTLALSLIALVALLHLYFLVLEMFLWTRPLGRKVFRMSPEKAEMTKVLAANQGLYNGFLVAGLVWSILAQRVDVATFFLACVTVAGAFGAATVSKRIFYVQALPAIVALAVIWFVG